MAPVFGFFDLWAIVIMAVDVSGGASLGITIGMAIAAAVVGQIVRPKCAAEPKTQKARATRTKPCRRPAASSPAYVPPSRSTSSSPIASARNPGVRDSIDAALSSLPAALLERSGSVFYTGPEAFTETRRVYLLGLNPGGNPDRQASETIGKSIADYRALTRQWSAYADDSWEGAPPGTWGLQPRVIHMLRKLDLNPRLTPASNVVFVRSTTEATLRAEKQQLLDMCWPVHQAVIDTLGVKAIICFGGTAGKWVREKVQANQFLDSVRETNARGWKSEAHQAENGRTVVTVTHPGRADWRNPAADPTPLVARVLKG